MLVLEDAFIAAWVQIRTGVAPSIERIGRRRARFTFHGVEADRLRTEYAASHEASVYATFQSLLRVIR
tara:strand:+ start:334 stop:537 length:204 start_codon:yes stop_codon:yes gene_type:complete